MKMMGTACIDAPVERVWQVLADVENIDLWVDPIQSAECVGGRTTGVGTRRVCHLQGGITVEEEWTDWDEGVSYTYVASGAPLMKSASNRWSVKPENGKTLLTTESVVVLKGGLFGKLLEPLVRLMSARVGADSLAAFKFLVETGRPFEGKKSALPRVSAVC